MALLTGTTMTTLVRLELGNPDTTSISDAEILAAINRSYWNVCRIEKPAQLRRILATWSTTADDREYPLVGTVGLTGFWFMDFVKDLTSGIKIPYRDLEFLQVQDEDETGAPQFYTTYPISTGVEQLFIYPTPDAAYNLGFYYFVQPTDIAAGTSSILGEEYDEIVKEGAVWRGFKILGEYDRRVDSQNMQRSLWADLTPTVDENRENEIIPPQTEHAGNW